MDTRKSVLTTGEVAKICNVAPRTVSKWFDSGQLRGYRIPGSKDRRIPLDHLLRFMRAHGIPLNGLDGGPKRVLILHHDMEWSRGLSRALGEDGGFEVSIAQSALETGAVATTFKPHVFVVDVECRDVTPKTVVQFLRGWPEIPVESLIAVADELPEGRTRALLQDGFTACLQVPFDATALVEHMDRRIPSGGLVGAM